MHLWLAVPAGHDGAVRGTKWNIDPFSRLVLSAHEGLSRARPETSHWGTMSIRDDGCHETIRRSDGMTPAWAIEKHRGPDAQVVSKKQTK